MDVNKSDKPVPRKVSHRSCNPGFCSLGPYEACDIPADTGCSAVDFCHSSGQCFNDQGSETVYCNCSDDRVGDTCQDVYTRDLTNCTSDTECGGQGQCVLSETGAKTRCQCDPGFRGDGCELEIRVYLEDTGLCQNGGRPYKQGANIGCTCPCGFKGAVCSDIAIEALWHMSCGVEICRGHGMCKFIIQGLRANVGCSCFENYGGVRCGQVTHNYTSGITNVPETTPTMPAMSTASFPDEDLISEKGLRTTCGPYVGCDGYNCREGLRCVVDKCGSPYCEYKERNSGTMYVIAFVVCFAIAFALVLQSTYCITRWKSNTDCRTVRPFLPDEPASPSGDDPGTEPMTLLGPPVYSSPGVEPCDCLQFSALPSYIEANEKPPSYFDVVKDYI